jgi:hypothetical protein
VWGPGTRYDPPAGNGWRLIAGDEIRGMERGDICFSGYCRRGRTEDDED